MPSYLDLLNRARGRQREGPISTSAIITNSGESLIGMQALNETIADILESSADLDQYQPINDVTVTSGVNTLTSPTGDNAWNPQQINRIKRVGTDDLVDLIQVSAERAKELEFALTTNSKPIFYYVSQGVVKVIPTPDNTYTLRVFYNSLVTQVDESNVNSEVLLPVDFHNTIVSGVFAHLRRASGDPEWVTFFNLFKEKLNRAFIRNKFGMKKQGLRKFRMARRNVDRTL